MDPAVQFHHTKEYWYISAFLNSMEVNEEVRDQKIETLLDLIEERLSNLKDSKEKESDFEYLERLPDVEENKRMLIKMGQIVSIECKWVPIFSGFSFTDEKRDFTRGIKPVPIIYDSLGYFEFKVDYNKLGSEKESIKPLLIPFTSSLIHYYH